MMLSPRLKSYARQVTADEIILSRDAGVEIILSDPDGQVLALLDLLDGTRILSELAAVLAQRWPDLTVEAVAEGVAALDEAGLLEDAAAETSLSAWQQERYFSNLAFFGTFADLQRSRYSFQETSTVPTSFCWASAGSAQPCSTTWPPSASAA
jgi:hypothetical protein